MAKGALASEQWQIMPEKSSVSFFSRSTFHDFKGQAHELFGNFEKKNDQIRGAVDVGIIGMTTDNDARDKEMYKMFDATSYSQIHFSFNNVSISEVSQRKDGRISFTGNMTIHQISRPVTIISRGWMLGDALICEGEFPVSLKDYNLKPPTILGLIRVNDKVLVKFRILFSQKEDIYAS